jgi:3'-phosphoadenosine 5'-phosphosulfate sulfotransferase (PAPS reductase)/FAD synthetase
MENHMIQIIKNQRRIMHALEVKSYSQIFTWLYCLLHEPSIIYSMQDKGFIFTEISDEEVQVIYKIKLNLA